MSRTVSMCPKALVHRRSSRTRICAKTESRTRVRPRNRNPDRLCTSLQARTLLSNARPGCSRRRAWPWLPGAVAPCKVERCGTFGTGRARPDGADSCCRTGRQPLAGRESKLRLTKHLAALSATLACASRQLAKQSAAPPTRRAIDRPRGSPVWPASCRYAGVGH